MVRLFPQELVRVAPEELTRALSVSSQSPLIPEVGDVDAGGSGLSLRTSMQVSAAPESECTTGTMELAELTRTCSVSSQTPLIVSVESPLPSPARWLGGSEFAQNAVQASDNGPGCTGVCSSMQDNREHRTGGVSDACMLGSNEESRTMDPLVPQVLVGQRTGKPSCYKPLTNHTNTQL